MRKYDIFISYRRKGGYEIAKHLYDILCKDGYIVSFDIDTLKSGDFDVELLTRIDNAKDFIVIFDKQSLYRCVENPLDNNDWLRKELSHALKTKKNIIPIFAYDFVFPEELPSDIVGVKSKNGIIYEKTGFDDMYRKLLSFLKSKPTNKIRRYFLSFCVVLIIAICYFFVPVNNKTTTDISHVNRKNIIMNVSVLDTMYVRTDEVISKHISYNDYVGVDSMDGIGPFYDKFHYIDTLRSDTLCIFPYGEYVGDYYKNDSIAITSPVFLGLGEDEYTNTHYPTLDVTIVNNSDQTIVINDLLIDVEESYITPNPFVIVEETAGTIWLHDRGWQHWDNATLRFSLLGENEIFDGKYKYERTISKTDSTSTSMMQYIIDYGIDYNSIGEKIQIGSFDENDGVPYWSPYSSDGEMLSYEFLNQLLYPAILEKEEHHYHDEEGGDEIYVNYKDPYLILNGELTFDNKKSYKIGGRIRILTSEGYGAPYLECSRVYNVKLKDEGKNYVIKYPVGHYLKAGDVDRIIIQLAADKTSHHKFRVRLDNVNGEEISTDPVNLLLFKYN
ncbi:MAG: TIR domain-containing protein [Rikenellaceae bacterium]|nr:TIR domain-containing protein [Rikenellaceae bacterium]